MEKQMAPAESGSPEFSRDLNEKPEGFSVRQAVPTYPPASPPSPARSPVNLAAAFERNTLKPSIPTFRSLLETHYGDLLRLNVLTGRQEILDRADNSWKEWTDVNDAQMRGWFQSNFGIYHEKMLRDALQIHFEAHRVNPLTDLLESFVWDGKPRIENFLRDVLRCADTPYHREVSRLIFAGGIWRAYRPGCKFDDMVVLVGRQGVGKSTLVRWLNVSDDFFREIKTISGKEGVEALRGAWIGEVAELMAMTRVREAEAVKAFITAREDSYRAPYDRHVRTIPRRCIFIGTTNNPQFLSDRTGNRRFYPVECRADGRDLLSREKEIREYIAQCWAEALTLFRENRLMPYADRTLLDVIRERQEAATEDDWRIGAISQYLDLMKTNPKSTVTVIELWHAALGEPEEIKPSRKDSMEIAQIILSIGGWKRVNSTVSTRWGTQKYYVKEQPYFPF